MRKTMMLMIILASIVSLISLTSSAAVTRSQVTDAGSYSVTTSSNSLLGVPTFGPGAFMSVSRKAKTSTSATFTVTNNSLNPVYISATIISADPLFTTATISPSAPGTYAATKGSTVTCTLTLKAKSNGTNGTYYVQVSISAATATPGYSSTVTVLIPVSVIN
jgi:hypothetical protein